MNNEIVLTEKDSFYYAEMISHPALFTHPQPKNIIIVGHYHGTVQEVLKHTDVREIWCVATTPSLEEGPVQDARVKYYIGPLVSWFNQYNTAYFDIIINNYCASLYVEKELQAYYRAYYHTLSANGMLVQPCPSSLANVNAIKTIIQAMQQSGFHDWQPLHFPQPNYPTGTRTVLLATKTPNVPPRIREKDIYNRAFTTRYYNYDTHRAALALPEFVRQALL